MNHFTEEYIKGEIQKIFPKVLEARHRLHEYPELAEHEEKTCALICEALAGLGIEHTLCAGFGVVGTIYGKRQVGKRQVENSKTVTVAIRADMDGLPLQEKTQLPYASKVNGLMHACGHDAHMSILLGAAEFFSKHRDELCGNVRLLFQPSEETIGGAKKMIECGCLQNPSVDAVIGLHVLPSLSSGKVRLCEGVMNASITDFKMKVVGKACHGAHPDKGADSIVAASSVVMALQSIVSRNISATDSAVVTVGTIHGGTETNIVSGETAMSGTIRTLDSDMAKYIKERVLQISKSVAEGYGCSCETEFLDSYPVLKNDDKIYRLMSDALDISLGRENVVRSAVPSLGADDFAYFCQNVPALYFELGSGYADRCDNPPIHNEYFDIDESSMKVGMLAEIMGALHLMEKL